MLFLKEHITSHLALRDFLLQLLQGSQFFLRGMSRQLVFCKKVVALLQMQYVEQIVIPQEKSSLFEDEAKIIESEGNTFLELTMDPQSRQTFDLDT